MAGESAADAGKVGEMPVRAHIPGEKDRIITPDDALRTEAAGDLFKALQCSRQRWRVFLIARRIAGDSILKVVMDASRLDLVEAGQQRLREACPEDKSGHVGRIQGDPGDLPPIVRVGDQAIALPDPVDEPGGKKARNVRPPACRDNHARTYEAAGFQSTSFTGEAV